MSQETSKETPSLSFELPGLPKCPTLGLRKSLHVVAAKTMEILSQVIYARNAKKSNKLTTVKGSANVTIAPIGEGLGQVLQVGAQKMVRENQ